MKHFALSETKENYLRIIYRLGHLDNKKIRVVDIAKYLDLKKSTVSERLQEMAGQKLINYTKYKEIALTESGKKIAEKLTYKHRVIEVFLHDMLKLPKEKVHDEAHKLEHAFSDDSIIKLSELLNNPKTDPHGQPIMSFTQSS